MRRLTESLLELARFDAGQEVMHRLPFDLAESARECVRLIRPLAERQGIRIQCDLAAASIRGDADRINQVITNLLSNAIYYNKEQGEVHVRVTGGNGAALLTVRDTGQGIATADLASIFERFFRTDKSRSSGRSGLGLAICQPIVEAHGGTITASSQAGEGATFSVLLPV